MDVLIDKLENESDYKSFHLDGQTIILEDYLQVRPELKERLIKLVKEEKLHIGPWYIQQDEFLTSSEANIRNLLMGRKQAKEFGPVSKIGYFLDSFGNIGQAPQILKQAGIKSVIFGRGVKPTGFNNSAGDAYDSQFSEMIWESPDGSQILGILLANWYNNGMEIPVEAEKVEAYWKDKLEQVEQFASTAQLLLMNGCDHQPVQTDVVNAIATASALYPDIEFIHSNFNDYIERITPSLPKDMTIVIGELRSQRSNGWTTLVNTASARVYIKQVNQKCQTLLQQVAEPLCVISSHLGYEYPHHLLNYAWKTLMKNHPHDSICGCSVDEVHQEMMTRFNKSRQVAESIVEESLAQITRHVDTCGFTKYAGESDKVIPFVVFNTTGWDRSGVVELELDIARLQFDHFNPEEEIDLMSKLDVQHGTLIDDKGNTVSFSMEDLGVQFRYELPDDAFRRRYMARIIKLTFEVERVPAIGYKTYAWCPKSVQINGAKPIEESRLYVSGERTMENRNLKVQIDNNGTLTLTDKRSGQVYSDLLIYEDVGDIGDEYVFKQAEGEVLTTEQEEARVRLLESTPYRIVYEIVHEMRIPTQADERLYKEMQRYNNFRYRHTGRSDETVSMTINTKVTLERNGKGVKIKSAFNNQAKDHRLRLLFPTDTDTAVHHADSIFEIAARDNQPAPEWENPSYCHHQQAFVSVNNPNRGLTIANLGLQEYEVLRDGRNTVAVTLLRAVGELGDWGVFPTPEAQCMGEHETEIEIIPHSGDGIQSGAFKEAYQFQVPWKLRQTDIHDGRFPSQQGFLSWQGNAMVLSGLKRSEETEDIIVRWFNMVLQEEELEFSVAFAYRHIYESNVIEERRMLIDKAPDNKLQIRLGPAEIKTLSIGT
jgi:alpha-mannosidase